MKKPDRRYATLVDGDGQVSNKTENKKRGFSSRLQYHNMLKIKNTKNKKYKEKSPSAHKLTYDNTASHIFVEKYKRWYITETPMQMVQSYFGDKIPDWFSSGDLKACPGYYDLDRKIYTWRPIKFANRLPDLKIYYTVVNRIDYCQRLIDTFPNMPNDIRMALIEIQDCYQLLSLHMELKSVFSDIALEKYHEDHGFLSPADMYNPTLGPPFSLGELPDVLKYISHIAFWSENDGIPTDNLLIQRLLFLLYKCLPYPYKRRSFENAIVESWSDIIQSVFGKNADKNQQEKERIEYERQFTTDIFQITMRIILASLLGVYEHCEVQANFRNRHKIYKWFCLNRPNKEDIGMWILRYKELVLCSFREFLFYMIERVGGLANYLGRTSYWNILKHNTFEMMDTARSQINSAIDNYHTDYGTSERGLENLWARVDDFCMSYNINKGALDRDAESFEWYPGMSWFYKVQRDMDSVNRTLLKNANRPKSATFEVMGLEKMADVEAWKKKKEQVNEDAIDPYYLDPVIKIYIQTKIKKTDPFIPFSYPWMGDLPVRCQPAVISQMKECEEMYELEEGASALKDLLDYLYSYRPYEYQVFKCYFKAMKKRQRLLVYYTSEDMMKRQLERLAKIMETRPGEELDESAGLHYVCTNCNKLKITIRDFSPLNNPDSLGGMTSEGVCINLSTGTFCCTKMSSKDNPKKRDPTKNIIKDLFARDNEKTDDDHTERNTVVDKVKRFMDLDSIRQLRKYVSPDERSSLDDYIRKREKQEQCLNTTLSPFYTVGHFLQDNHGWSFMCPQCCKQVYFSRDVYRNGVANMSCGCKTRKSECTFRCRVCNADCYDNCFIKAVWDDGLSSEKNKQGEFVYVCLCETHRNKWTSESQTLPKVSQLEGYKRSVYIRDGNVVLSQQTVSKPVKPIVKKKKGYHEVLERKMRNVANKSKARRVSGFSTDGLL